MLKNVLCCMLAASLLVGCSGGPNNPPTQKVTGTVTLDGSPVEGAIITFVPDSGSTGVPCSGKTDAEGNYAMTSYAADDGAVVGSYKIQVAKYATADGGMSPYGDTPEPEAPASPPKKMTEEEEMANMAAGYTAKDAQPKGRQKTSRKNDLPEKYASIASSGLAYEVVEGDNVVPIELKKK